MQDQNARRTPLLTDRGRLARPCWAATDIFEYNKDRLRRPGRRKEWEFYQVSNARFTCQLTYGTVAYAGNVGVTLVDFETGERFSSGPVRFFPGDRFDLDFTTGQPHNLIFDEGGLFLTIAFDGRVRRLTCRSDRFDVDLACRDAGDAIVTATPFARKGCFYYNYKKVFQDLAGTIRLNGVDYVLDTQTFLLLDSGRGVWPYRHRWVWGSGARDTGGHILALNVGWGFAADGGPTENALFWDGTLCKLDTVREDYDPLSPMTPWRLWSDDGRLDAEFTPRYDNFTETNYLLVHNRCHQVYGALRGRVRLPDDRRVELGGMDFFCEHADNRW